MMVHNTKICLTLEAGELETKYFSFWIRSNK